MFSFCHFPITFLSAKEIVLQIITIMTKSPLSPSPLPYSRHWQYFLFNSFSSPNVLHLNGQWNSQTIFTKLQSSVNHVLEISCIFPLQKGSPRKITCSPTKPKFHIPMSNAYLPCKFNILLFKNRIFYMESAVFPSFWTWLTSWKHQNQHHWLKTSSLHSRRLKTWFWQKTSANLFF